MRARCPWNHSWRGLDSVGPDGLWSPDQIIHEIRQGNKPGILRGGCHLSFGSFPAVTNTVRFQQVHDPSVLLHEVKELAHQSVRL
jgi:hypothetical protein